LHGQWLLVLDAGAGTALGRWLLPVVIHEVQRQLLACRRPARGDAHRRRGLEPAQRRGEPGRLRRVQYRSVSRAPVRRQPVVRDYVEQDVLVEQLLAELPKRLDGSYV